MIRWLRVRILRLLSRLTLVNQFCRVCGAQEDTVWLAPDELWLDVVGSHAGVMCVRCFDQACARRGLLLMWRPEVDARRVHEEGSAGE